MKNDYNSENLRKVLTKRNFKIELFFVILNVLFVRETYIFANPALKVSLL